MYRYTQNKILFIFFGLIFLMFPQTTYAYLDPGTGSYVIQVVLAAMVGLAYTLKIYWTNVKTFFLNLFSKK